MFGYSATRLYNRCGRRGWRFQPFSETPDYDAAAVTDVSKEIEVISRDFWLNPAVGRDLQQELTRESADAIVVDCMQSRRRGRPGARPRARYHWTRR